MYVFGSGEKVVSGMFTREPICPGGSWYVYKNARGKYHAVDAGSRISQIELKAENYTTRYTVTKGSNTYKHFGDYHSADPGRDFQISVQVNLSVADPVAAVQSDIKNIQDYMATNIKYWIETITVQYTIEDFHELKDKIHNLVHNSNMVIELEKRGFQAYQLQAVASLGQKEWQFYEQQENIKRTAALELARIAEQDKIRQAEAEIRQKEEQTQKERELREEDERRARKLKEEEEERARKLKDEQEQMERDRITREEKQKERKRIAELGEEKGLDRMILERDEENQGNLDLLIKREQEEKELQQKREQERIEYERKLEEERLKFEMEKEKQRLEFEMELEKRKLDMVQKMMEKTLEAGELDPEIFDRITKIITPAAAASTAPQVETKKAEQIEWGSKSQVNVKDEDDKDDDWS